MGRRSMLRFSNTAMLGGFRRHKNRRRHAEVPKGQ
jgi:hypothetical protein